MKSQFFNKHAKYAMKYFENTKNSVFPKNFYFWISIGFIKSSTILIERVVHTHFYVMWFSNADNISLLISNNISSGNIYHASFLEKHFMRSWIYSN